MNIIDFTGKEISCLVEPTKLNFFLPENVTKIVLVGFKFTLSFYKIAYETNIFNQFKALFKINCYLI